MRTLTAAAQRWLATHHGVITARQLAACGVSRATTSKLVELGVLRRVTRGVFVLTAVAPSLHQRAAILSATYPGGFVTGPTAGMLAGLRRMPSAAELHFSLRHGVNPEPEAGVRFRQTTKLQPSDRRVLPDGISMASWPRLAFDLAADLRRLDHLSVVNQLLDRRDVTADALRAIGCRLSHPGRRGTMTFNQTLSRLGSGQPQDSNDEVTLLDALRARGVPVEPQVPISTAVGPLHVDLGVADVRWGVELDIHPEHRTLEGHRQDAERRRATNDVDWQVEIVAELDMVRLAELADRLAVNYRRRVVRITSYPSTG